MKMRHAAAVLDEFVSGTSLHDLAVAWGLSHGYTRDQIENVIRRALIRAERRRKNGIGGRR